MPNVFARVIALVVFIPALASAQAMRPQISIGAGMDAVLYDGSQLIPGYVGHAGVELRNQSRAALRLGLLHYRQNRRDSDEFFGGCSAQCMADRNYATTGLILDGTFDLTRGRFRPYLLSGAGLYRTSVMNARNYDCTGFGFEVSCAYSGDMRGHPVRSWDAGLHSGLGITANFGKATFFTEARFMAVFSSSGQNSRGLLPVILGVKF